MASTNKSDKSSQNENAGAAPARHVGVGGELHQVAAPGGDVLTTNFGTPISDDHNSLRAGPRGALLLEDFVLREKIFHFDHERIPERVVHARGLAAHGFFELTDSLSDLTTALVLGEVGEKTPVFTRFSTVAGNRGSADLARDVRGFAVKFYTKQGNWDLVGNNIPVFFIQDAMKFPDLAHAVKEEPDRGFPQAQSAHDTFWDWIAMTPEAMHMVMWQMSDRTIPRSMRMMQGFGVHSFRLVNAEGKSTFVKFHWTPKLGMQSVVWDEAVKINGADPDFHRRDLYNAIEAGDFPEWELGVQLFSEDDAAGFDFDHLDSTKLIPEEVVPLRVIGRLVLDRNPANVFDETEQVAFCTQNLVPGIDFSDDPLLHGRNFSYLDTQLSRLGSTNFNQIPINAPKCPFANMQRDGHMQTRVHPQRVTYTPSLLDPSGPRESHDKGFRSFPTPLDGAKQRERSATFADHYSQARQFFLSQTEPEQDHIVAALVFELSKVETEIVRTTMLGHLVVVDEDLGDRVAAGLGHSDPITPATPAVAVRADIALAPSVSMLARGVPPLTGRKFGALVTDGASAALVTSLRKAVAAEGAMLQIICPTIGGVSLDDGSKLKADHQLAGGPSVLFDAVAVVASEDGTSALLAESAAVAWVHDAFAHLKVIGATPEAGPLLDAAGVEADEGVATMDGDAAGFVEAAAGGRVWAREPDVRTVY
ncbi:catalase [Polymorphobacter fuscus]|uniref:Catalase n=1 Tax=Sandarakinorhabdus fusca TaxID=1439888 RepID=A0A7C9KXM7_9SPHN|nr:catalase [Polymorphobacter fuscus]KAB7645577.1 catalase [Polymorphobacter fuscus]MQT18025.1 catalase [Polymorphobacter fuscus]NJC08657.1 catalase [Polymorphobacter fuscus]